MNPDQVAALLLLIADLRIALGQASAERDQLLAAAKTADSQPAKE